MNAIRTNAMAQEIRSDWHRFLDEQKNVLLNGNRNTLSATLPTPYWEKALLAPVREILSRPGKGFRARLVQAGSALVDPEHTVPDAAIAIVELLHAGSLIIDDIEDGSATRRGGPSMHVLFGMPTALNSGNWMYFVALEQTERLGLDPERTLQLYRRVNQTMMDCHRGQALDLGLQIGDVRHADLPTAVAETTRLKTGALAALAPAIGAICAGATSAQVHEVAVFGEALGVALQQLDDLGNLTTTAGDKQHEDLLNGRMTWPWAWAAEALTSWQFAQLERKARELMEQPAATARDATALAQRLRDIAGPHRRVRISTELARALARLSSTFGCNDVITSLQNDIRKLEKSYG
jgi:geranylgeranyl pyrophosphate synthase